MTLRVALVAIALAALLTGCSTDGKASSQGTTGNLGGPSTVEGYSGKSPTLYDYAYTHCYTLAKQAATAQPFGSGPAIYPLTKGIPLVAVGSLKPSGNSQMLAVKRGCALAMVKAFSDAGSDFTAQLCNQDRPYLPADVPACKS